MNRIVFCFAVMLAVLFTSACATAVMNNTATGDRSAENDGYPTLQQDSRITREVRMAMYRDPLLSDERIQVSTAQGVVTLRGSVSNRMHASRARQIARAVEGVRGVTIELRVTDNP